jgi:AcrR family transcriptional regulator
METRESIIASARRLFYLRGYDRTSLADIAAAARVPKGNFYYHFKSKDDVLRAVLETRDRDVAKMLERWSEKIATPRGRIERVIQMLTHDQADLVRLGCPVGSLLSELGKGRDELKAPLLGTLDRFVDFVATQLKALGRSDAKARQEAIHLLARCQGAVVMAHAYTDPKLLAREVRAIRSAIAAA